jgi:hypothetical protein
MSTPVENGFGIRRRTRFCKKDLKQVHLSVLKLEISLHNRGSTTNRFTECSERVHLKPEIGRQLLNESTKMESLNLFTW